MNGHEQRKRNILKGLGWISDFGGTRTAELGQFMWPMDAYARTRADRLARDLVENDLVLVRPLPERAGRLLVLSEAGARFLRNEGNEANSGKDIGETEDGVWLAPANWKHDLLAVGVLAKLYERGYEIQPERQVRMHNPALTKIPDGFAWLPERRDEAIWIEVENSRKTGKNMQELAAALCRVSNGNCPPVSGLKPVHVLVAFVADATDERRYKLSHRERVTAAIRRVATRDVIIFWATCTLRGAGVSKLEVEKEQIAAVTDPRMMTIMQTIDWHLDAETGVFSAQYGERRFYIWGDEEMGWYFELNDRPAEQANSHEEALRGCARLLMEDKAPRTHLVS